MKKIKIDVTTGNIFLDDIHILPLDEVDFLLAFGSQFIDKNQYPAEYGLTAYSNSNIACGSYSFEAKVWFKNGFLEMLSLHWLDGITKQKGWDSSDADLINDKSSLTRLIKKIAGKNPDKTEDYEDLFKFHWGDIAVHGVIQAMYPKIDITWLQKDIK